MADEPRYLRIRNWERYQVFKDGRPMKFAAVWARSDDEHTGIFDDPAFMRLADDPECPIFRLFALAALTGNKIPNDGEYLRTRLFCTRRINMEKMLGAGILEPHPDYGSTERCTEPYESVPITITITDRKDNHNHKTPGLDERQEALDELLAALKHRSQRTDGLIRATASALPTAAYRAVLIDELGARRRNTEVAPLRNESFYVLSILDKWIKEKRYAA